MDLNFSTLSLEDLERIIELANKEKEDRADKADKKAIDDFLNAWRAVDARNLDIHYMDWKGNELILDIDSVEIY